MFKYFNHLGYNNPYYINNNGKFEIQKSFPEIIKSQLQSLVVDPVAVTEMINKGFFLADRTILQGIKKTPWQAKPNEELNQWIFAEAPKHGYLKHTENIAEVFFQKICSEIELYIGNKTRVGILLSGGMDSRMVAGALDFLIKTGNLKNVKVTGLTWGNEGTRDVVYAKEIAQRLGWHWKHYKVTTENLKNNITETAVNGCEYSPFHLHAIPQIRDDNDDIEVILAGSYGDSVGRAEYSGENVRNLKPLNDGIRNIGRIIQKNIYNDSLMHIHQDIDLYHIHFPRKEMYMQYELDYQLHYMRRMLNSCMQLLTEKMEFYQVFTHPAVFGYMWSIHPEKRNDLVYENMLNLFKTNLKDIPWARTGLPYGNANGTPDAFFKEHHNYGQQINQILFEQIDLNISLHHLDKLGIFNMNAVKTLITLLRKYPTSNRFFLDRIFWLISLSEMCLHYDINGIQQNLSSENDNLIPFTIHYEYLKTNTLFSGKNYVKKILTKYFFYEIHKRT
jgi:hypothetical protein